MNKKRSQRSTTEATQTTSPAPRRGDGMREIVESIVIALILAFFFRAFEGEAFEIPTGSMGPTLMGRHKDIDCPACGLNYEVGASHEVDQATGRVLFQHMTQTATCPNCRFTAAVGPGAPDEVPSHKGDRLWVSKPPFIVSTPHRWDVTVLKYPIQSSENYIKRLVGLPNETIRIQRGNIYVRSAGEEEFAIARKPPAKVRAMMQIVYDNDQQPVALREWGWPARWHSQRGWSSDEEQRRFTTDGKADEEVWLRYRHVVPGFDDWRDLSIGQPLSQEPRPQLVTDFTAYNTATPYNGAPGPAPSVSSLGLHWVPDLILECDLDVRSTEGEVALEMVKGGRRFQCRFDIATGQATLSNSADADFSATAQTRVRGQGRYAIRLANVDDGLILWVNGAVVPFDGTTTYQTPDDEIPQPEDLFPVGISARGAEVSVSGLKLYRDVYYIAHRGSGRELSVFTDFEQNPYLFPHLTRHRLAEFMSRPDLWEAFRDLRTVEFELQADQYFALGDNSPNSSDSRFWAGEHYFERDLLIGKAFFIYWPAAKAPDWAIEVPFRGRHFRFPFYPNFGRMGFIR